MGAWDPWEEALSSEARPLIALDTPSSWQRAALVPKGPPQAQMLSSLTGPRAAAGQEQGASSAKQRL